MSLTPAQAAHTLGTIYIGYICRCLCCPLSWCPTEVALRLDAVHPLLAVAVPLIRHAWTDERVLALDEDLTVSTGAVEGAWRW